MVQGDWVRHAGLRVAAVALSAIAATAASTERYPASAIPPRLRANATAVIRYMEQRLVVGSCNRARIHTRVVTTVLEPRGDRHAEVRLPYGAFNRVYGVRGTVCDSTGRKVAGFGGGSLTDYPLEDQSLLYSDERVKSYSPRCRQYPYTVQLEYSERLRGTFALPDWEPQPAPDVSVVSSRLVVVAPTALAMRFNPVRLKAAQGVASLHGKTAWTWEIGTLPAYGNLVLCPPMHEIAPMLQVQALNFVVAGTRGSWATWDDFGRWYRGLLRSDSTLTSRTLGDLHARLVGARDSLDVARRVYMYMQSRTRYVGIERGIGYWKPRAPAEVDRSGHSDCKGLSRYCQVLLSAAGIRSYLCLVPTRAHDFRLEFPASYFNHAILCAVAGTDTAWLECTDQESPFGYVGGHVAGRPGLLVGDRGASVVAIRRHTAEDNRRVRVYDVKIDSAGNGDVSERGRYCGERVDEVRGELSLDAERGRRAISEALRFGDFTVGRFSCRMTRDGFVPEASESINVRVRSLAPLSSGVMLIPFNPADPLERLVPHEPPRLVPVAVERSLVDIDTFNYHLPEGYGATNLPADVDVSGPQGEYHCRVRAAGATVQVTRLLLIREGRYPADRFGDIIGFHNDAAAADNRKVVVQNGG